jgi:hypothetical protein
MKIRTEKGFTLVESLLALIALALIVFVGFYVYNSTHKANNTLDKANTETSKTAATTTKYLDIKELGIKIPLNDKLDGLKYTIAPTDNTTVSFSTAKFDQSVGDCQNRDAAAASTPGIGTVVKVAGRYDSNAQPHDFFSEFSKQFSDFYLTFGTADGGPSLLCTDKTPSKVQAVEDIFNATSPALKQAVKNAQLIN